MGLDAEAVALSPLGPSQSGRFYGINNLLETMLLAPALVGAALLGRAGILVAALAFVTIGGNRFGADGGGIVVLAAAYLVLWLRLRPRAATFRLAFGVAAGAVAIALLLLAAPGSSHVTDAIGDGPAALAGDIADRIELSVRRTAESAGATAVVLGSLAILAAIALRARRDAVLDAFLVGVAVSLLVNDTPGDVAGMGAAIAIALARHPPLETALDSAPMRRAAPLLAPLVLVARPRRLRRRRRGRPTPETVIGTLPEETTAEEARRPRRSRATPRTARDLRLGRAAAGATRSRRPDRRARSARTSTTRSRRVARGRPRHERPGAMPAFEGQLSEQEIADVVRLRRREHVGLTLPDGFPARRRRDRVRPRPHADRRGRRPAAAHDRRVRTRRRPRASASCSRRAGCSARSSPTRGPAGIEAPLVCYQGAAVVDPASGEWLLHEPIPLELAREAIARRREEGFALNCYVDDDLYVAEITEHARAYADFQSLPLHEVGDLLGWLERPPTKLVVVDDPDALDALRPRLVERFGNRLFIAKSLPYFLELASPAISKGSGLAFVAEHLGFAASETVAFGDGENDLELLEWAGFGVCVEDGHELLQARADWICPGAGRRGRRAGDRGLSRLHGADRPQGRPQRPGRLSGRARSAREPPRRSTSCSGPTSAGARSCRGSTSCADDEAEGQAVAGAAGRAAAA